MRANATSSAPEWRKPTDQDPNPRQRSTSTREGNRGNRGGRGRGRGGNGGGPSRKHSNPASQDTAAPTLKLVVDPPTAANTPAEPSSIPKSNSSSKPTRKNSVAVSEDPASISSQTSARPPNRRRGSQQRKPSVAASNTSSNLLNVQTLTRKASTGPSSPNPAKDLPPHLPVVTSATATTELKSDLDALVERVRSVAMDRPHTPGSHIDWADDDDSLPDLNDWGYTEGITTSVQPEEPPTTITPILEDVPPQSVIPEVKVGGEPSPGETITQEPTPRPAPDPTPRTHRVQKKRGTRTKGSSRTQQSPPALNLTESVSQGPPLSPIQSTTSPAIPHTIKPQGQKRPNSRNNQGQTDSKDNGGSRQRGQNGATVASPMRNSFPAKTGPKADNTPPVQSQVPARGPDIAHSVTNPHTESDSKVLEPMEETVPDDEGKKETPIKIPHSADTNDSNPNPTVTDHTLRELEPTPDSDNPKPDPPLDQNNKRSSYSPSHSRSHTYGGRTQGDQQLPRSVSASNFSHHSPPNSRNPRSSNSRQSPSMRSSGLGPGPRSAGYDGHIRNHSSPPGITRPPQSTRPVISGDALTRLARSLGSTPGSPKKDPPAS